VLHVEEPLTATRTAGLLLACLQGGTTYAHACALAALARVLPPTPDVAASIEVRAGAQTRTFAIGGEAGDAVHWLLPRADAVTVRGPAGVPLLVRVTTERAETASDHAAWQTPLKVERELCTSRPDANWRERRDGTDLVVLQEPPLAGRPYALRVRVQSPVPMRFVVVECPLPAGFEFSGEVRGVDRYDDRLVFTCDLTDGEPHVTVLPVMPTVAGRLLWPPVVAAPMYVAGLEGGTAGGFVDVADAASGSLPAAVTCFTRPALPRPPEDADPFEPFFRAFDAAWSREPVDEAASRRAVEALLAQPPQVTDAEAWRWLARLTASLDHLELPDLAASGREVQWRHSVSDRLRAMLREATLAALALPAAGAPESAGDECLALGKAIALWPEPPRQALLARVIERARGHAPGFVGSLVDQVQAPATDAALCAELRACLASPIAELRHAAFAALPPAEQADVPPVLAIAAQQGVFDAGVIRMLAATETGRAELRLRLLAPGFTVAQIDRLAAELPEELWREVPLPAFRSLAMSSIARDSFPADAVARRVAAGTFATADLQQAMAAAIEPPWRAVLGAALRLRSARAAPAAVRADDPLWPLWCAALALDPSDAAGAARLLDDLAAQRGSSELDLAPGLLAVFAVAPIVAAGTPQQLYAARKLMTGASWRAAWHRLDGDARAALLDHFKKHIDDAFVPATVPEAEAVWRFFLRSGDAEGTAAAMGASAAGIACLRRHLAAGEGGEAATALRDVIATDLKLDPQTLLPSADDPWRSLLLRARITGFAGEWTADEQAQLAAARALRGVAPLGNR